MASHRVHASTSPDQRPLLRAWVRGTLVCSVLSIATACTCGDSSPAPTKVAPDDARLLPARERKPVGPFRNPNESSPPPREGEQLSTEELDETLIEAQRFEDQGETVRAMHLLYRCANKLPPSARCDGALGMLLLENRTRKPHANYFVQQAASFDDADADAAFYRRLAKTSAKWARFETATTAWQRVMDRVGDEATAEDWAGYAAALQGERTRKEEAIRALAKAYELAPSNHQYLHDQAVLVAQTGDAEKSIELFEQYKTASSPPPREVAAIDARIATLRREIAPQEKTAD